MRFTGPFSSRGTFGEAVANRDTPSVGSVALGDFDRNGSPDEVAVTLRLSDLSGGEVYVDPFHDGAQQKGNGLIAATGDINGDGYADLVTGDPDEPDQAGVDGVLGGRVLVWYGSAHGITRDARPCSSPRTPRVFPARARRETASAVPRGGRPQPGRAGGHRHRLAERGHGQGGRGAGHDHPRPPHRRLGGGAYAFTQDTAHVPGGSETEDDFGTTVAVGDINKDGRPELFVSAAAEDNFTGAVWVFPGGNAGPTAKGSRMFTAPSVGLPQKDSTLLGGNGLLGVI